MPDILKPIAGAQTRKVQERKISVIGVGSVGMAAAFSIYVKGIANVIALVDMAGDKVKGEILDMKHGKMFAPHCEVMGCTDYCITANSDIVLVTAGARQQEGESRLNLVQRNVNIFKSIIPEIVKNSPNCILVIVSNPVDILTYVAAKISGFPPNRVLGSGTMLDSARFRTILGEKLGIAASSIHAHIIGEHGDSSVPVWSKVNIAGVQLVSVNPCVGSPQDPEHFGVIHKQVIDSAYDIIKLKGYTSWAIGLTCSALCEAILKDQYSIIPVSTNAKGHYGIENDVYLSLPCLINGNGVTHVITPNLNNDEKQKFLASANSMLEVIRGIQW